MGASETFFQQRHTISFSVDVELSDAVISDVEARIRELRQGIEKKPEETDEKAKITNHLLRYDLDIEVISASGQLRVMNERLSALRKNGQGAKARNPFIEKMGNKLTCAWKVRLIQLIMKSDWITRSFPRRFIRLITHT